MSFFQPNIEILHVPTEESLAQLPDMPNGCVRFADDTGAHYMFSGGSWYQIANTLELAEKEPIIATGTSSQYMRGDKSWQTLDKTAVGLPNVPNTDATQRSNHTGSQAISTVTGLQTALDGKEATVSTGTTAQYYRGDKTWQAHDKASVGLGSVPNTDATQRSNHTGTQAISTVTGLQTALDSKTAVYVYDQGVKITPGTPQTGDTIIWHDQTTTSGGNATFYVSSDRTNAGTAICSSLRNGTVDAAIIDSTGATARGESVITSDKQITVPITKQSINGIVILTSINVIGTITQPAAPNGITVRLYVIGIKA